MGAANDLTLKAAENESYTTLNLVGRAKDDSVELLSEFMQEHEKKRPQDIIVNCQHLSELSAQWLRALMKLVQKQKSVNKHLRLIYPNENIKREIHQAGLAGSLRSQSNLHAALVDIGLSTPKMLDVNFINPFLLATTKVLQMQASTKATTGQVYKKSPHEKFQGDISGVIGLISEAFSGSVVISFPSQTFLKIMSRMLGEEYTTITKEIEDGAGELTNIIFGQAKALLNEQGFGIKTALPSVIMGNDHSVLPMTSGPRVVVPFESDAGPFFIEICLS